VSSVLRFTRSSKLSNLTSRCTKRFIRGIRLHRLSRKSLATDYFNWRNGMPREHRSKTDRNVLPVRSGLLCRVVDPVFATLQNCLSPAHDHRRSAQSSNRVHLSCLELLTKPPSPSLGIGRAALPFARTASVKSESTPLVLACCASPKERIHPELIGRCLLLSNSVITIHQSVAQLNTSINR